MARVGAVLPPAESSGRSRRCWHSRDFGAFGSFDAAVFASELELLSQELDLLSRFR